MKKFVSFRAKDIFRNQTAEYSCNPSEITDWSKDPAKPNYLSQCFFKKSVLEKYYNSGEKMPIQVDKDHESYVMAYLGDLGGLSYEEQSYWRSYNLEPTKEMKISKAAFDGDYMSIFTEPSSPDSLFKTLYNLLNEKWKEKFGYNLFLTLGEADKHRFESLKIPLYDNQKNFDEESLNLGVVFIDTLNESELKNGIDIKSGDKGITKFGKQLEQLGYGESIITLMRNIQDLRNGVHLKGEKYDRGYDYFKIEELGYKRGFIRILMLLNKEIDLLLKRLLT